MNKIIEKIKNKRKSLLFYIGGMLLFNFVIFLFFADIRYENHWATISFSHSAKVLIVFFTFIPIVPLAWIWPMLFLPLLRYNYKIASGAMVFCSLVLCLCAIYYNRPSYFLRTNFDSDVSLTIEEFYSENDIDWKNALGKFRSNQPYFEKLVNSGWRKTTYDKINKNELHWGKYVLPSSHILESNEKSIEKYILTNDYIEYHFYFFEK